MKTWNERAQAVFAQGCNTYSKRADQYIEGVYPTHVGPFKTSKPCIAGTGWAEGADGSNVLRLYCDYVCGLGSNLIDIRNNYSLPHINEVVLAERIKALFPCIDKMKLVKTGSAACSAAVRIARAYTGRKKIFGSGYHGTDDWAISAEWPGTGTLHEAQEYHKYRDLDQLIWAIKTQSSPAAVIIEPVQLDLNVRPQLEEIRRLCTENGIVLIFDEVITGFRFPKYSVSNYFGIQPDLICLGKALGNGYPIALVGGREDIMQTPDYFISSTHNGELSAIQSALDTLDYLTEDKLQDLWERGDYLNREFNKLSPKVQMVGYPTRSELQGDEDFKNLFLQEMCTRGYFFGRARFLTFAHTMEIIEETLHVAMQTIAEIEAGDIKLEGLAPRPVFRRN